MMSENPYRSPGLTPDAADHNDMVPERPWQRNLSILAWLAIGSPMGWAGCTLLWRLGYLRPFHDAFATFVVMVAPMILTGMFGARRHPELLIRLILFPGALAGLVWSLAPCPNIGIEGLNRLCVNRFYPYLIVPATIIGGAIALVTARSKPTNRDAKFPQQLP